MPDYAYHAVDQTGRATDGTMSADSEHALEQRLREIGYWLIEAKEHGARRSTRISSVPRRELIDFFSGMASLMDAGIPMAEAISAMAEETAHTSLRAVLEDVSVNVQAGQELGRVSVELDGNVVADLGLVALADVPEAGFVGRTMDGIKLWIDGFFSDE